MDSTSSRLPTCKADCSHPPPIDRRCNAHTRAGRLCSHGAGQRTAHPGEGRCYLHGGKTPRGIESPHFRHGVDSRYFARELNADLDLYRAVKFVQELAKDLRGAGPIEVRLTSTAAREDLARGLERMAAGGWVIHDATKVRAARGIPR